MSLLDIANLTIGIPRGRATPLVIVENASLRLQPGEMLGLIGESGSGKTMLCRSLIGTLRRRGAAILSGRITLAGTDLAHTDERAWRDIRGRRVGYVPQSALAGPNPVMTIGAQLREAILQGTPGTDVPARARELLALVQIRRPELVLDQYPHQLSGGMRQRVMIACAIAGTPELLVADEPTTGLDVTVQAGIMQLLRDIRARLGTAIILVSHDLALVDDVCDRILVMHAGACVESVPANATPRHPYTIALNRSRIELAEPGAPLITIAGQPPSVGDWPPGCRFAARCSIAQPDCSLGPHPPLRGEAHANACLHPERAA